MVEYGINLLNVARAFPVEQGLAPVLEAIFLFASVAIGVGVWIARRAVKTLRTGTQELPCRRHEWVRLDGGGFLCARCDYRAGSR